MSERFPEFLVNANGQAPRNLKDAIRLVGTASAGFRASWGEGLKEDALETSQEAFKDLDYIQNEILRQRDFRKTDVGWLQSPFKLALMAHVGQIVDPVSDGDVLAFNLLPQGAGALPSNPAPSPLSLEESFNKLKHRSIFALNFALPPAGGHLLYALTPASMGRLATVCEVDIATLLGACRKVVPLI